MVGAVVGCRISRSLKILLHLVLSVLINIGDLKANIKAAAQGMRDPSLPSGGSGILNQCL